MSELFGSYGFSGYKDPDQLILLDLPSSDVIKICTLNKYLLEKVCDESFFRKKLGKDFPDALKTKEDKQTYKDLFLKIMFYIGKLKEKFGYSHISGNPIRQYFILQNSLYNDSKDINYYGVRNRVMEHGEIDFLQDLMKKNKDLFIGDPFYNTTNLLTAIRNRQLKVVKFLIDNNLVKYKHLNLMNLAKQTHDTEMINYFIEKGIK